MTKFADNENLGKVAKLTRAYSFGVDPITDYNDIIFCAGGSKFSTTCGLVFHSKKEDVKFPEFKIVFCTKFRSKIYHQQNTNPSKWFIFVPHSKTDVYVLSKKDLLKQYGFDIDEFFNSDLFAKYVNLFIKSCVNGIKDAVKYVQSQPVEDETSTDHKNKPRSNAKRAIKTIYEAVPLIKKPIVNDKTYLLHDYDINK